MANSRGVPFPRHFKPGPLLRRIGKCLAFGCDAAQTTRAAALVRILVQDGPRLRAKQKGFPIKPGLFVENVRLLKPIGAAKTIRGHEALRKLRFVDREWGLGPWAAKVAKGDVEEENTGAEEEGEEMDLGAVVEDADDYGNPKTGKWRSWWRASTLEGWATFHRAVPTYTWLTEHSGLRVLRWLRATADEEAARKWDPEGERYIRDVFRSYVVDVSQSEPLVLPDTVNLYHRLIGPQRVAHIDDRERQTPRDRWTVVAAVWSHRKQDIIAHINMPLVLPQAPSRWMVNELKRASGTNDDENAKALERAVFELEGETWDRKDAVEDLGGADAGEGGGAGVGNKATKQRG